MKLSNLKNYCYNVLYQIIQIASALLVIPYISRILGAERVGYYSYTQSNITILILFCTLGINLYSQRELATFTVDRINAARFVYEILILRFSAVIIGSSMFLIYLFTRPQELKQHLYFLQLLDILSAALDITWIYQAYGKFKQLAVRNITIKLIYIISVFIFVRSPNDLDQYILCYSVTGILGNILLWKEIQGFTTKVGIKCLHPFRHFLPVLSLFLPQAATQVYTILDKSMIGSITESPLQNGYYEQATKIVRTLLMAVTSLGTVMLTQNAKLAADKSGLLEKEVVESLKFNLWIAIPISAGSIGIAPTLLPLFLGNEFDNSIPIMQILSLTIILIAVSNVTGVQYLLAVRRQRDFSKTVVSGAIINLMLNLILIPKSGALGAAIASVIAEICVTYLQIVIIRKDIDFSWEFLINIVKCFLAAGGMFYMIQILNRHLTIGWFRLLIQVAVSAIAYYGISYLLKEENTRKLFGFGNRRQNKIK